MPGAQPKTTFTTVPGHQQYHVLPSGLHGVPMTFQCLMDIMLHAHHDFALAYLIDIIHSSTRTEHLHHLKFILGKLRKTGLTANPQKYHEGLTKVQHLGYFISWEKDRCHAELLPAHHQAPGVFLGLARYYHRFMSNFSSLAFPLSNLTKKGDPDKIKWTGQMEQAFQDLKKAFTTTPVL